MSGGDSTVDRVRTLIRDLLGVDVPHDDTDMIDSRLIDSLALVSLIAEVEYEFELTVPLEDLDVDQFRSVERIAQLVASLHMSGDAAVVRAAARADRPR